MEGVIVEEGREEEVESVSLEDERVGVPIAPAAPPPVAPPNANNQQRRGIPLLRYLRLLTVWRYSCVFFICYFVPLLLAIIGVVSVDAGAKCDKALWEWLIFLGVLYFLLLVLTARVYHGLPNVADARDVQEQRVKAIFKWYVLSRFLDFLWFVWSLLGIVWTFTTDCGDTGHHLRRMCVAMVFIHVALFCFATVFCCCTCCGLLYQIAVSSDNRAPSGASKKMIKALKAKAFKESDIQKEDASCAICLAEYEENELIRYLPCKHHFHGECVDQWLQINKSCPLCKNIIDQQPQQAPLGP